MKRINHFLSISFLIPLLLVVCSCSNDVNTDEQYSDDNNLGERVKDLTVYDATGWVGASDFAFQESRLFSREFNSIVSEAIYSHDYESRVVKQLDEVVNQYQDKHLYGTINLSGTTDKQSAHDIKTWTLHVGDDIEQEATIHYDFTNLEVGTLYISLRKEFGINADLQLSKSAWPAAKEDITKRLDKIIKQCDISDKNNYGTIEVSVKWESEDSEPVVFYKCTIPDDLF